MRLSAKRIDELTPDALERLRPEAEQILAATSSLTILLCNLFTNTVQSFCKNLTIISQRSYDYAPSYPSYSVRQARLPEV